MSDLAHASGLPMPDLAAEAGRIDGWPQWHQALLVAWREAAQRGGEMWLQDATFTEWPLGLTDAVQAWHDWAVQHPRAQAHLLALDWGAARQAHPRWCRWQPTWAHRVHVRHLPQEELGGLGAFSPTMVLGGTLALWLDDAEQGRGGWSRSAHIIRTLTQMVDANLQRSSDSGGPSMLGL
jgi:hypothetical protein